MLFDLLRGLFVASANGSLILSQQAKMASIESKIDKLMALVESLITTVRMPPPGLHTTECELIQERLERLETVFVCSPSLAPTVDEVLNQMLSITTESTKKDDKLQKLYEKDRIVLPSIPHFPLDAHGDHIVYSNNQECAYFDIGDSHTEAIAEHGPTCIDASCQTSAASHGKERSDHTLPIHCKTLELGRVPMFPALRDDANTDGGGGPGYVKGGGLPNPTSGGGGGGGEGGGISAMEAAAVVERSPERWRPAYCDHCGIKIDYRKCF